MTDKKLTDNEIIKALECCSNYNDCDKCNFEPKDNKKKTIGCCLETMKNALNLITRQQADNENLKVENQSLRSAANSLKMHYKEAQTEIERLKEFIVETRRCDKEIKSEARKEFAERLKDIFEHAFQFEYGYLLSKDVINAKIDYLVKEMVCEKNEV